jgi:hypothetical protein
MRVGRTAQSKLDVPMLVVVQVRMVEIVLLAFGCLQGHPVAVAAFEAGYLAHARTAARRLGLSDAETKDVRQSVRQRSPSATRATQSQPTIHEAKRSHRHSRRSKPSS